MNKKQNKKGYIAIEAVIVGAIVLAAGIASLMPFGSRMLDARTKLMGVFGMGEGTDGEALPDVEIDMSKYNDDGKFKSIIFGGPDDFIFNYTIGEPNSVNDFKYEDVGYAYKITKYLNLTDKTVVIPAYYNDKPITTIGEFAFLGRDLEYIELPNTVQFIEEGAFHNNNLTSLSLPNSVRKIGVGAFSLNYIKNLTLSDNLNEIGA